MFDPVSQVELENDLRSTLNAARTVADEISWKIQNHGAGYCPGPGWEPFAVTGDGPITVWWRRAVIGADAE